MEVLNAAGLTSFSLHKLTRNSQSRTLSSFRQPTSKTNHHSSLHLGFVEFLSLGFTGSLAAISATLGGNGSANALTYEEALGLGQATESAVSDISADVDVSGFLDGIANFVTENPLVIGGGALALAVPLVLSQILKKPKNRGFESAKNAFAKLGEDGAELIDIREGKELKEVGSPDLKGLKKKAVSISYRGDDKVGFLKKLELKFKDPSSTTLFILDKFDGNSELVAELVTANGFKAAFAIKDGAEGARGWLNSGLPWTQPKKSLSLDFEGLKDAITSTLGEGSDGLVAVGLAAAAGLGVVAVTEIETVLQLLGSAAIIQFVTKKLLYAEDRKVTLKQVDEFLVTKIAPAELVDEIKGIGKALLPTFSTTRASLPAPTEENVVAENVATSAPPAEVLKVDSTPETIEAKVEPAAEQPPIVNSVTKAEVVEESVPAPQRALSPYPFYPDFKPPTSPTPSAP